MDRADNTGMPAVGRIVWFSGLAGLSWISGCATPGPGPGSYAVREVGANRGAVLIAAQDTLVDLGYRIARRDTAAGIVTTHPIYTTADRPRVGFARRRRHMAEIHGDESGDHAKTYCRVVVQELATEVYRMQAVDRRSSDVPSDTAIDRDAATTRKQNTVWKPIRRDRALERQILTSIAERIGTEAPGEPPVAEP